LKRKLGENGYLEIERKRVRSEAGEVEMVALTRGIVGPDGAKRPTRFVAIPADPACVAWLAEALRRV